MKAFLQGRWLGEPLHPMLVHFPIALIPATVIFDILSLATGDNAWIKAATIALLIGVIGAVLAAIAGSAEWVDIPTSAQRTRAMATMHAILNLIAAAFALVSLIIHFADWNNATISVWAFILVLISLALIVFSGYLGGELVYDHHLGVGRDESTGHPYLHDQKGEMPERGRMPRRVRSAGQHR